MDAAAQCSALALRNRNGSRDELCFDLGRDSDERHLESARDRRTRGRTSGSAVGVGVPESPRARTRRFCLTTVFQLPFRWSECLNGQSGRAWRMSEMASDKVFEIDYPAARSLPQGTRLLPGLE